MKIEIEDGTVENPQYDSHKRAKNWVAIVEKDKSQPGGLRRTFLDRAPGGRVHVSEVKIGDWLEFAGDYYTASGSKNAHRTYARVIEINGDLHCEECEQREVGRQTEAEEVSPLLAYSTVDLKVELARRAEHGE